MPETKSHANELVRIVVRRPDVGMVAVLSFRPNPATLDDLSFSVNYPIPLDSRIENLVKALMFLGVGTMSSCEGHEEYARGGAAPNVMLLGRPNEQQLDTLRRLLKVYNDAHETKWQLLENRVRYGDAHIDGFGTCRNNPEWRQYLDEARLILHEESHKNYGKTDGCESQHSKEGWYVSDPGYYELTTLELPKDSKELLRLKESADGLAEVIFRFAKNARLQRTDNRTMGVSRVEP